MKFHIKKKILKGVLLFVCVIIIALSLYYLYNYFYNKNNNKRIQKFVDINDTYQPYYIGEPNNTVDNKLPALISTRKYYLDGLLTVTTNNKHIYSILKSGTSVPYITYYDSTQNSWIKYYISINSMTDPRLNPNNIINKINPPITNPETNSANPIFCSDTSGLLLAANKNTLFYYNEGTNSSEHVDCLYYMNLNSDGTIPNQGSATFKCLALPPLSLFTTSTTFPNSSTTFPNTSTTFPNSSTTFPNTSTTFPNTSTTFPNTSSNILTTILGALDAEAITDSLKIATQVTLPDRVIFTESFYDTHSTTFDKIKVIVANQNILFALGCNDSVNGNNNLYYYVLDNGSLPSNSDSNYSINWKSYQISKANFIINKLCINDSCIFIYYVNIITSTLLITYSPIIINNNGILNLNLHSFGDSSTFTSPLTTSSTSPFTTSSMSPFTTSSTSPLTNRSTSPLTNSSTSPLTNSSTFPLTTSSTYPLTTSSNIYFDKITVNNDVIWTLDFANNKLWWFALTDGIPTPVTLTKFWKSYDLIESFINIIEPFENIFSARSSIIDIILYNNQFIIFGTSINVTIPLYTTSSSPVSTSVSSTVSTAVFTSPSPTISRSNTKYTSTTTSPSTTLQSKTSKYNRTYSRKNKYKYKPINANKSFEISSKFFPIVRMN